jgi:biopolymer transport protein ExbD
MQKIPEINAGSMADIAFLLLVFFLVTTTIQTDSGIATLLPQWQENPEKTIRHPENVLEVHLNGANQLMVEGVNNFPIDQLMDKTIKFITNNGSDPTLSDNAKAAVVSIHTDQATNYASYLAVYNELQAAYNRIWNSEAKRRYGKAYDQLTKEEKLAIREDYPKFISEAEPTDFAGR